MTDNDQATIAARLAAPFELSEHAKVPKGGMTQTYAPWTAYVQRMDEVLTPFGWSEQIVREGYSDTECWALASVTVWIDGREITREQYGCEPIMKGTKPTADLMKVVGTDAIKKAISLFGPGLYLSVTEEREKIDQAMREAIREEAARQRGDRPQAPQNASDPRGGSQGAPSPIRPPVAAEEPPAVLEAGARSALENRYEALRTEALDRGFQASWRNQKADAWTDAQLPKYVGLLARFLDRQSGAA